MRPTVKRGSLAVRTAIIVKIEYRNEYIKLKCKLIGSNERDVNTTQIPCKLFSMKSGSVGGSYGIVMQMYVQTTRNRAHREHTKTMIK